MNIGSYFYNNKKTSNVDVMDLKQDYKMKKYILL